MPTWTFVSSYLNFHRKLPYSIRSLHSDMAAHLTVWTTVTWSLLQRHSARISSAARWLQLSSMKIETAVRTDRSTGTGAFRYRSELLPFDILKNKDCYITTQQHNNTTHRHNSTTQQHISTTAHQHNSTSAQQHNGTSAQQHNTTAHQHKSTTTQQHSTSTQEHNNTTAHHNSTAHQHKSTTKQQHISTRAQ